MFASLLRKLDLEAPYLALNARLNHREKRVFQAVAVGTFARLVTLASSFIGTSLLVKLLHGQAGYGVFVTITTLVGWIQLSNLGFGLGLQNTLIAAVAGGDAERQKRLLSTTQFALLALCGVVFLVWSSLFLSGAVSWTRALNAEASPFAAEVPMAVFLSGCLVIVQMLLSYISPYYLAHQRLHRYGWWTFASQIAGFLGLVAAFQGRVGLVATILLFQGAPLAVLLVNAAWLTARERAFLVPRLARFSLAELRQITTVGMSFFVIMVTGALQYSLDNIILSRALSPADVTPYNLATKLYSIWYTLSAILINPLWAAFGNAFAVNDLAWVRRRFSQLRFAVLAAYVLFALGVTLFGQWAIRLWVGPDIHVSVLLLALVGLYYLARQWLDLYSMLVNAVNAVKINAALALPGGLYSAACMYLGAHWGGVNGMLLGMAVALLSFGGWVMPLIATRALARRAAEARHA